MSVPGKMKQYLRDNKIKKRKKDSRKLPKGNRDGKGPKIIVWIILILIIILSPLGFLRAQTALEKSKHAESTLEKMAEGEDKQETDVYSSPMLTVFADDFVNQYINIPREEEERADKKEKLKNYYANDVSALDIGEFRGYRQLDNKTLYDISFDDDRAIMSYLIEYTNVVIEEVEEEKEVGEGKDKKKVKEMTEKEHPEKQTVMLNVPVRANEKGGYAVVESPFYSSIPDVVNNDLERVTNPLKGESKIKTKKAAEIREWIEGFLTDYASKDKEEMTYVMDEPRALNGKQEFVSIQKISAYPTNKENRYTIKAVAIFKEKEIDITHPENLTLIVEKKDGKYFVKEMNNTLGGH